MPGLGTRRIVGSMLATPTFSAPAGYRPAPRRAPVWHVAAPIASLIAASTIVFATTACERSPLPTASSDAAAMATPAPPPAEQGPSQEPKQEPTRKDTVKKTIRSDEEWRRLLSPEAYRVLRRAGTEAPFSGTLYKTSTPGTYACAGCGLPLFRSDAKFDAGCGWPSFFEPLEGAHLEEKVDRSHGMSRIEVVCRGCNSHLGHVFTDGPEPTGLRYCINSVCLVHEPDSSAPASR